MNDGTGIQDVVETLIARGLTDISRVYEVEGVPGCLDILVSLPCDEMLITMLVGDDHARLVGDGREIEVPLTQVVQSVLGWCRR